MGYVLVLLTAFFVSLTTVAAKFATAAVGNFFVMFIYFVSGGLVSVAIWLINSSSRSSRNHRQRTFRDWFYFACHTLLVAMGWYFTLDAIRLLAAGQVAFLSRLEIVLTFVLAVIVFKETLLPIAKWGGLLVIIGAVVMRFDSLQMPTNTMGMVYIVLASISFALVDIFAKLVSGAFSASLFTALRNLVLALFCVVPLLFMEGWPEVNIMTLVATIVGGVCGPGLARVFYMLAIERVPLTICTLMSQCEPVITSILAYFLFSEVFTLREAAGGALIILGVLIILDFRKIFVSAKFRVRDRMHLQNRSSSRSRK